MANIYVSSVGYSFVTTWSPGMTALSTDNGGRGTYVRQLTTPAVGSERVFRCTTGGTASATEPVWVLTKNAVQPTDGSIIWIECTGQEADQVAGTWRAPHAKLANAFVATWGADSDTYFVAHNHVESQASAMTLTKGSVTANVTSAVKVLCVNSTGSMPPVAADLNMTAVIGTSGVNVFTLSGYGYYEGITFVGGTGASSANMNIISDTNSWIYLKNCTISSPITTTCAVILGGSGNAIYRKLTLDNSGFNFGSIGSYLAVRALHVVWKNTVSAITGTAPSALFNSSQIALVEVSNVDLSAMVTGKTLIASASQNAKYVFTDCKIDPAVNINGTFGSSSAPEIYFNRTSGANINYNLAKYNYVGSQVPETTILKTSGASDGTTPMSWKITSTSNCNKFDNFKSIVIPFWVETIGFNVTATVEGIWSDAGSALPKDDEIWCEISFLGSTTAPMGSEVNDRAATVLTVGSPQTTSAVAWISSPATPVKFKLNQTFLPQKKGMAYMTIRVGKPSTTYYIDPLVVLS